MKRIQRLSSPTSGLKTYLDEGMEVDKDWDGFRNHEGGNSYLKVIEMLIEIQHGLCGYCEIDIRETDRQVEHVIPQSDPNRGAAHALNHCNMIACCKGGTIFAHDNDNVRRLDPVRHNLSCGQAKANLVDADFIDPRTLPALPSVTRVIFTGKIEADGAACESNGIAIDRVEKTIKFLGLNSERLRRAREHRWNALRDNWGPEIDDPVLMGTAASGELLPGEDNRLSKFFTTNRSYFGIYGEMVLSELPMDWI